MWNKRPSFIPVASSEPPDADIMSKTLSLSHKNVTFSASLWVWIALALLLLSNILFLTAFVTNHWGVAYSGNDTRWEIGLWQSCRYNPDFDLCIGPGWPPFYSAARSFMVLGLFGHILLFAWLIGYALEKLLDYDPCTLGCLVGLSFSTAIFVTIAVACFGIHWPSYVREEINFVKEARMDYSVYLPIPCIFFLVAVGVLLIVEIRTSLLRIMAQGQFPAAQPKEIWNISTSTERVPSDDDDVVSGPHGKIHVTVL